MNPVRACAMTLLAWLLLAPAASAEPVRIVSGALVWTDPLADVALTGDSEGFTYSGRGDTRLGRFGPWDQCSVPACIEGTAVPLGTGLDGSLLGGTATLRGTTYRVSSGANPEFAVIGLDWFGSLVIPSGFTGGTLTAPFRFSGNFGYPADPNNTFYYVPLAGSGLASVTFQPWPNNFYPGAFEVTAARFEFNAADPVPEPASMFLIGTGLAALAVRRRRRA